MSSKKKEPKKSKEIGSNTINLAERFAQSGKFKAMFRVTKYRWPPSTWRVTIQLKDGVGRAVARAEETIETAGHVRTNRTKRRKESRDSPMRYGTVVQYFPAKGFGFIRPDFGPDIFFHITALGACESQLQIEPGQPVKYELVPGTEAPPGWRDRA